MHASNHKSACSYNVLYQTTDISLELSKSWILFTINLIGYLILHNVGKIQLPIDDLSQTVEKSNYLKRKARIIEGGIIRVEKQEANKLLKSAELLLCIAGLYHMLKGWKEPESPINLSDIRLFIPA